MKTDQKQKLNKIAQINRSQQKDGSLVYTWRKKFRTPSMSMPAMLTDA